MMMPWLILGIINSFFFRVGTASANGNGYIKLNSARELGRSIFFQMPTNPGAGNNFGTFTIFYLNNAFMIV